MYYIYILCIYIYIYICKYIIDIMQHLQFLLELSSGFIDVRRGPGELSSFAPKKHVKPRSSTF